MTFKWLSNDKSLCMNLHPNGISNEFQPLVDWKVMARNNWLVAPCVCQKFEFIILFLLSLSRVKTIESHCNFNTVKSLEFMICQLSIFVVNLVIFPPSSPRICIFDEYKNSFVTETDNRRIHEIKNTYIHENRSQRM